LADPSPIAREIVAHLESPVSVIVGAVAPDGSPLAAHCCGARVLDGGTQVRVTVNGEERELLADLGATAVAAVSATEVPTLRSIQLKGRIVAVEEATAEDRIRTEQWRAGFFALVHEVDGVAVELLEHVMPLELAAFVLEVDEVYDQTPGPQAGSRLDRSEAGAP
jgi:hypothetical protein